MTISEMNLKQRSLLFANLAADAYGEEATVREVVKEHGFTDVEFYNLDGAQAFRFENETDIVIACRGTQPTEFNDLKADLKAFPVVAETVSRVHRGFKTEVDELWPEIRQVLKIQRKDIQTLKKLWFCGHSLGAAMATIMAGRCMDDPALANPVQLYTYGSPRVGWPGYIKNLKICHKRWQNNNDIVTRVPFRIMGYKHCGDLMYIKHDGTIDDSGKSNPWRRFNDRMKGMWGGIKKGKIDNFSDHAMAEYIPHLEKW